MPTRLAMATPFHRLAVMEQLVTRHAEREFGRIVVRQLGLLEEQHVRGRSLEPAFQRLEAGIERIDVPGGDAHVRQA
jgi:hypothetical protein